MANAKKRYRIRNWSEYNRALIQRGSITLWFDQARSNGLLFQERKNSSFYERKLIRNRNGKSQCVIENYANFTHYLLNSKPR